MAHPPRLAEWLLASRLRPHERSMVLGDLAEGFDQVHRQHGQTRATWWYWRETAGLGFGLMWITPQERLTTGRVMAMDDARYAWRRIRKHPLTSLASIATLALGIGAAAATWSLIANVLLHPVQVPAADRVVRLEATLTTPRGPITSSGLLYPGVQVIRGAGLMPMAAWGSIGARSPLLVDINGAKASRGVRFTTANFLDVLDIQPQLGRYFSDADDQPDAPLVAVISDRSWRRDFASDPGVVGREIIVRDRPTRIVGVLPRGFRGLEVRSNPDLYMPLRSITYVQGYQVDAGRVDLFGERPPVHWIGVVGRLPDGVSAESMAARINTLDVSTIPSLQSRRFTFVDVERAALAEGARADLRHFATLLGTTVALLLAIGSMTVGTLLLIRTESRRQEFATCLALGAGRWRLAAGVGLEGLILTTLGVALSVPVSHLVFQGIGNFELPGSIRLSLLDLSVDGSVLIGAAAAAGLSVLAIAAIASVFALRGTIGSALRSQGAAARVTRRRSRAALVTAQVAVALVLVTGATLFGTSLARSLSLNPGIDTSRVLRTSVDPGAIGYDKARRDVFFQELRRRLAQQPAITSLSLSSSRFGTKQLAVDGQDETFQAFVSLRGIDDRYVDTFGLSVLAGRALTAEDRAGTTPVALVSAAFARAISGDSDVLGRRIGPQPAQGLTTAVDIVGVVANIAHPQSLNPLVVYLPSSQYELPSYPGDGGTDLAVRASRDTASVERAVRDTLRALEPALVPRAMTTLDDDILASMAPQQFGLTVLGALGGIALLLSVLGAYVLAETAASQRRREMGIRAALGGTGRHLRLLLLSETFRLVGLGLVAGFGLSWIGAGTIRSFLFQVDPLDPWVVATAASLILALSLAVAIGPAWSASRADLAAILRDE